MSDKKETYERLHRRLIALYPREFRERFGESMEQTFNDLRTEQSVIRLYADTAVSVVKENTLHFLQRSAMRETIIDPTWAAIISFILFVPFVTTFAITMFELEPFIAPLKALTTLDGQQINTVGRVLIFGGVLLLPVAFLVNLSSMFTKRSVETTMSFHPRLINIVLGAVLLFFVVMIGYWAVTESISCSTQGICD